MKYLKNNIVNTRRNEVLYNCSSFLNFIGVGLKTSFEKDENKYIKEIYGTFLEYKNVIHPQKDAKLINANVMRLLDFY